MNREDLYAYCASKKAAEKTFPFDHEILVFKVMNKMFALSNINETVPRVNLKCDPDWSLLLREHYAAIEPGWHMNKKHWNTVVLDGTVPDEEIKELIDHSYNLVVKGLRKVDKEKLAKW